MSKQIPSLRDANAEWGVKWSEIYNWCEANCRHDFKAAITFWSFTDPGDAMLFKLRWG